MRQWMAAGLDSAVRRLRVKLVVEGDGAAPRLHARDSERPVLRRPRSDADKVQACADVGGMVRNRARAARRWTVALRENLIRRRINHDERSMMFHAPSMVPADGGRECRRSPVP